MGALAYTRSGVWASSHMLQFHVTEVHGHNPMRGACLPLAAPSAGLGTVGLTLRICSQGRGREQVLGLV